MKGASDAGHGCVRVLVAESHETYSNILTGALRRQRGIKVISCKCELSECKSVLQSVPVDIMLIGNYRCDQNQLVETLRGIHSAHPKVGLILLMNSNDRNLVVEVVRAGVRGLFAANQSFRALCRCISVVNQGQIWATSEQINYMIEALRSTQTRPITDVTGKELLSPREEQVVNLVAAGGRNREIALQLSMKENTVKKSLLRIFDKLGVSNRVELVLYALADRAVEPPDLPVPKESSVPNPSEPQQGEPTRPHFVGHGALL